MTQRALETEKGVPLKLLILGWSGTALPADAKTVVSIRRWRGATGGRGQLGFCSEPATFRRRVFLQDHWQLTAHGGGGDAATEQRGRHGHGGAAGDGHGRALQEHGVGGGGGSIGRRGW